MISLALQMVRWSVILGIAAAVTLTALVIQVRYEGDGRFQIGLKPSIGLEGTFVGGELAEREQLASARTDSSARAEPAAAALPAHARECAAVRARLRQAVQAYEKKTRLPMSTLDIFALLEAEVLAELPACPKGGSYRRAVGGGVGCSRHKH